MSAFVRVALAKAALATAALAMLLSGHVEAAAGGAGAVRKQIEASMLVRGKIEIDPQGRVARYSLDQQEKLPSGVVGLIGQAVPGWRFEPVLADGKPVSAIAGMSIRVVANRADEDHYTVKIRSASFGDKGLKPEEDVRAIRMTPPPYPVDAVRGGVAGAAYLLVKVGRDGKVMDVATEQVNLRVIASENEMERWRKVLATASMSQARKWTFTPPTKGDAVDDPYWVVRVPVVYSLDPSWKAEHYGEWQSYIPGPRQRNPWDDEDEGMAFSPDTLAPGGSYLAGTGLKLLSNPSDS